MKFIITFILIFCGFMFAQEETGLNTTKLLQFDTTSVYKISNSESYYFEKPGPFEHFSYFPGDIYAYSAETFSYANIPNIINMTLLTTMLVLMDQSLIDGAQKLGRKMGIKGHRKVQNIAWIGDFPIQMPIDFSSSLYFIGDGWTHTSITSGFLLYGLIDSDNRALRTASQLAEGLLTVTFATQLLKHLTGRESPYKATQSGGKWRLFPNQVDYHKNVPAYDAFPSGHLASAFMVFTIVSENYKEYSFIKPLGYSLLSILSFQMMNNGVHWASDYPLAIAMGYSFGMIAMGHGKHILDNSLLSGMEINTGLVGHSAFGVNLVFNLK